MCGCSSSFDGDFDEIESNKTFSFVSDVETDNEFDDFFGKKAKERRRKRKDDRRRKRGLKRAGYSGKDARQLAKAGESVESINNSNNTESYDEEDLSIPSGSDDYETELGGMGDNQSVGMSNTKKVLIGVGIAGIIGLSIYFIKRKK